ncbi:hypothetical protein NMG60_11004417 [Bertholletia excelsa]
MMKEILVSVTLLLVGIAVLVIIHVCVVGRAFGRSYENGTNTVIQVNTSIMNRRTSMSLDEIKKLPYFEFKLGGEGIECAVCLENFKVGDKCRLLPHCSHSFHAHCIDSWLSKAAACPICRTAASSRPETDGSSEVREELV